MKKVLKIIFIFLLLFVVFLYFVGSCTERPETYTSNNESSVTEVEELTPEEYEERLNKVIQDSQKKNMSKGGILQANAGWQDDLLNDFFNDTTFFPSAGDVADFFSGYFNYLKNPDAEYYDDNPSYPINPAEPKEEITVPYEYKLSGKNKIIYEGGVSEIIICNITTTDYSTDYKTGVIKYDRIGSFGSTTFSFEIRCTSISKTFDSDHGVAFNYVGIPGKYAVGVTESFLSKKHRCNFVGTSVNSLNTIFVKSSKALSNEVICYDTDYHQYKANVFTSSSLVSNDYEFIQTFKIYTSSNKYWSFPISYVNNGGGNVINKNNVSNYNEYGYTYNNITNSIEFDPDVYADFFDLNIKPKLQAEYDLIFSRFPDIDAVFGDDNIHYNDIVSIIQQIQQSTETTITTEVTVTTATVFYPVVTGDINVNVEVTFPPEFYKTYPPLNTEPAFVAENPDVDFAFDAPLPVRALEVSGGLITLASSFIEDVGLMPIVLMGIALGFVVMFFL